MMTLSWVLNACFDLKYPYDRRVSHKIMSGPVRPVWLHWNEKGSRPPRAVTETRKQYSRESRGHIQVIVHAWCHCCEWTTGWQQVCSTTENYRVRIHFVHWRRRSAACVQDSASRTTRLKCRHTASSQVWAKIEKRLSFRAQKRMRSVSSNA